MLLPATDTGQLKGTLLVTVLGLLTQGTDQ
jgi:hypothetical protein